MSFWDYFALGVALFIGFALTKSWIAFSGKAANFVLGRKEVGQCDPRLLPTVEAEQVWNEHTHRFERAPESDSLIAEAFDRISLIEIEQALDCNLVVIYSDRAPNHNDISRVWQKTSGACWVQTSEGNLRPTVWELTQDHNLHFHWSQVPGTGEGRMQATILQRGATLLSINAIAKAKMGQFITAVSNARERSADNEARYSALSKEWKRWLDSMEEDARMMLLAILSVRDDREPLPVGPEETRRRRINLDD